MASDLLRSALLDGISGSAAARSAHYREQATKLRHAAEGAKFGQLREELIDLAEQYEELAASTETGRFC